MSLCRLFKELWMPDEQNTVYGLECVTAKVMRKDWKITKIPLKAALIDVF